MGASLWIGWRESCSLERQESRDVRVAMPRFGEQIAPCFGYAATITIFTIAGGKVIDEVDFCLQSNDILDRFRLVRDQQVGTLSAADWKSV